MSKTIDLSDPSQLSDDDKRYLQERGQLPAGVEPVPLGVPGTPLGDLLHTGDANTLGITADELRARLDRLAELEAKEAERNFEKDQEELKRQKAGVTPLDDESDDTTVEQYKKADGWDDDRLQQELGRRGLPVEGDRKTMRARLIQNDRDN